MAEAIVETNQTARFYCHCCDMEFREAAHVLIYTVIKITIFIKQFNNYRITHVRTVVTASLKNYKKRNRSIWTIGRTKMTM